MAEKEAMNSLDTKCNDLKHAYDSCFNTWFAESFLKRVGGRVGSGGGGDATNSTSKATLPPRTPCDAMLKAYSDCVKDAMKEQNMDPKLCAKYWEEVKFMGDDNDKFPKGSANQDSN